MDLRKQLQLLPNQYVYWILLNFVSLTKYHLRMKLITFVSPGRSNTEDIRRFDIALRNASEGLTK